MKRLEEYRRALAIDPQNAALHNSMGNVLLDELEDPVDAEQHYRAALRIKPDNRVYQRDLFHSVARRSLLYRVFSLPSRSFTWLGRVGHALRYQPWRLIFLLMFLPIGFKFVLAYFGWLVTVTVLFWPAGKIYEWFLVSEIKYAQGASMSMVMAWHRIQQWSFSTRLLLFLGLNVALWIGLFLALGVPVGKGLYFLLLFVVLHFACTATLLGYRKVKVRFARSRRHARPL